MSAPTVPATSRSGAEPRVGARHDSGRPPGVRRATVPGPRGSSGAVGRAYAKRASRRQRLADGAGLSSLGRSRFVLMVMVLLGAGLVASLWLSTTAAADSYRLEEATRATRDLSERSETLRTEIAALRSAPALAQAARDMGMVPTSDVARLVAMPDGSVRVVGTPKAAVAPAPPAPPLLPGQLANPGDPTAALAEQPLPEGQSGVQQPEPEQAEIQRPASEQPVPGAPGQLAAGAGR